MKEADCYEPIRAWFIQQGYLASSQASELGDIIAVRSDHKTVVAVEAKIADARAAVGQALDYLKFAHYSYVAIPKGGKERRDLLTNTGLGLLIVDGSKVHEELKPKPSNVRIESDTMRVLRTIVADPNSTSTSLDFSKCSLDFSKCDAIITKLETMYMDLVKNHAIPPLKTETERLDLDEFEVVDPGYLDCVMRSLQDNVVDEWSGIRAEIEPLELELVRQYNSIKHLSSDKTNTITALSFARWLGTWKQWPKVQDEAGIDYRHPPGFPERLIIPEMRLSRVHPTEDHKPYTKSKNGKPIPDHLQRPPIVAMTITLNHFMRELVNELGVEFVLRLNKYETLTELPKNYWSSPPPNFADET